MTTTPPPPPAFDDAPTGDQVRAALHSDEAEQAVIGSVLINADYLSDVMFLAPDDFHVIRNRMVFEAFLWLHEHRAAIDVRTVAQRLQDAGQADEVGLHYLALLLNSVPSSLHAADYARTVRRDAIRRRMLAASERVAQLAMDGTLTTDELVSQAGAAISGLRAAETGELTSAEQAMPGYVNELERRMLAGDAHCLIGLPELDGITRGFARKNLIYIASRTGQGKTSLMLGTAAHEARRGKRVAVFSMEMSTPEVIDRLISAESGIPVGDLRAGTVGDLSLSRLRAAQTIVERWPLWIDETAALTPLQMAAKLRRAAMIYGEFDLVIVDYVQLMSADRTAGKKFGNRYEEVTEVSRMLKVLAGDLGVTMIAGAQMSRAVDQRQDKRPSLSDLRDSGGLEQDANAVIFIHTPDQNVSAERVLIVAKNRQGDTGDASVIFDGPHTRFLPAHTVSLK